MKQYYPNLFYSEPSLYQSAGQQTQEYKTFGEDYQRIVLDVKDPIVPSDKYNTRINIRQWEVWAVLGNALIEPHHKLLEYGAWPTFYCAYVSHLVGEVFAIDNLQGFGRNDGNFWASLHKMFPDVWMSEINKYNRSNLQVLKMDIQHTTFEDKYFDRVVSYGVHEHVKDDLQGLKEIHRILKDSGVVSMTIDFFHHGWKYNDALQGRCYDPRTLISLVNEAGFEFIYPMDWGVHDANKDTINTLQSPTVYALCVTLRKQL